jgi:hypothetical protein
MVVALRRTPVLFNVACDGHQKVIAFTTDCAGVRHHVPVSGVATIIIAEAHQVADLHLLADTFSLVEGAGSGNNPFDVVGPPDLGLSLIVSVFLAALGVELQKETDGEVSGRRRSCLFAKSDGLKNKPATIIMIIFWPEGIWSVLKQLDLLCHVEIEGPESCDIVACQVGELDDFTRLGPDFHGAGYLTPSHRRSSCRSNFLRMLSSNIIFRMLVRNSISLA